MKWGARVLRVRSVSREEVWASTGVRPPRTSPGKLTHHVGVSVRPPRTGMSTSSGFRGLGAERVVVLEVRIGVATRARGAGGGRLQANELEVPDRIEVAPGEKVLSECRISV